MTYAQLKTDVAAKAHNTGLSTLMDTFLREAEKDIRQDVRVRAMETSGSIVITSGTAPLPTGFLEAQRLILDNSQAWKLDYMPPSRFYSAGTYNGTGPTKNYTIEGDNIIFRPAVDQDALLGYYKAFDAFTDDADTNWLLENTNIYLYAMLVNVADYLEDDRRLAKWAARYAAAVSKVNKANERSRYAGNALKSMGNGGP